MSSGKPFVNRKLLNAALSRGRIYRNMGRRDRAVSLYSNDSDSASINENAASSSRQDQSPRRHPPHLKGKEIGMWYASHNRKVKTPKPLATILLSDEKKQHILSLLESTSCYVNQNQSIRAKTFQKEFQRNIEGSIDDKLRVSMTLGRNTSLDEELLKEQQDKAQNNAKYKKMLSYRERLPAYNKRDEIVKLIEDNQVVVISGETGCGKTTQVPQFILDNYIENSKGSTCSIICSQPRRISAISVAERVADERGESLGHSCGFHIRLESDLPRPRGSIIYCTTGVILRQMASDPLMSNVSHLILDEIHERDIMSDFLIALMRKVLPQRPDMKLILMSATLNSAQFSSYYGDCPMANIPGFTYAVQEFYLEDALAATGFKFTIPPKFIRMNKDDKKIFHGKKRAKELAEVIGPYINQLEADKKYSVEVCKELRHPFSEVLSLELIVELLKYICRTAENKGAILVFVTGYANISQTIKLMEDSGSFPNRDYIIIPLHSQMPSAEQKYVFQPAKGNMRKIIISTNIAETSITIDDVVYVIDSGHMKLKGFNANTNTETLDETFVSLANAHQRRGRAGRVRPGICYHLYNKARETLLEQYTLPEILRTRLENVILHAKALQLGKAQAFLGTLIDIPEKDNIERSLQLLTRIDALDEEENLTPLGYHLSKLPMAPKMGKMILFGVIFSCLDPILSICSTMDFKDAFQLPIGKEAEADERKLQLSRGIKSDHILSHIVLAEYERSSTKYKYCRENFLSEQTIKMLIRMKTQFMDILYDMHFVQNRDSKDSMCNLNSHNLSLIKAVVCAGLYPNIALVSYRRRSMVRIRTEEQYGKQQLKFHRTSILSQFRSFESPLITYHKRIKLLEDFIFDATHIHPLAVIFFGDKYRHGRPATEHFPHVIAISNKLVFKCTESTADIIKQLRERLNAYLQRAIIEPSAEPFFKRDQNDVISAIIELITNEDIAEIDLDAFGDE